MADVSGLRGSGDADEILAALRLLRLALPLLDRAQSEMAAVHLQAAIDAADDGTPGS